MNWKCRFIGHKWRRLSNNPMSFSSLTEVCIRCPSDNIKKHWKIIHKKEKIDWDFLKLTLIVGFSFNAGFFMATMIIILQLADIIKILTN